MREAALSSYCSDVTSHDPRLVAYLEEMQRKAGREQINREALALSPEEIERLVGRVLEERAITSPAQLNVVRKELLQSWDHDSPSRYEPPWMYSVLLSRYQAIDQVARSFQHGIAEAPLLGTIDTGAINALCMDPPEAPGYLLLFESQMFSFCRAVAAAFVNALPAGEEPDDMIGFDYSMSGVASKLRADQDARVHFLTPIFAYAVHGNLEGVPRVPLAPLCHTYNDMLRISMELFVVGHEYGHLMAGHLESMKASSDSDGLDAAGDWMHSWVREIEADLLGIRLALPAAMTLLSVDPSIPFQGAALFFVALDLMDRAVSILTSGVADTEQLGTHPTASVRLERLITGLPEVFAAHDETIFRSAIMGAEQLMKLADVLWYEACWPSLMVARDEGVQPWAGWRVRPRARAERRTT